MPDTVLEGCEILCLLPISELIGCPLPPEEQKKCKQRLQYEAGKRAGSDEEIKRCFERCAYYYDIGKKAGMSRMAEKLHTAFDEGALMGRIEGTRIGRKNVVDWIQRGNVAIYQLNDDGSLALLESINGYVFWIVQCRRWGVR